jgi:hypothetical protein
MIPVVSGDAAAWFALGGALGASAIATIGTVYAGVLHRRHERQTRRSELKQEAYTAIIAKARDFRAKAKTLCVAGETAANGGRQILESEIDGYLDASWKLSAAAQEAELLIANTATADPLDRIEKAFYELSRHVSVETAGVVKPSAGGTAAGTLDQALRGFDDACDAFIEAAQNELGLI